MQLAASTPGMTGADLANLVNEAALLAARSRGTECFQRDLMEALEKVQLGPRATSSSRRGSTPDGVSRSGPCAVGDVAAGRRSRAQGLHHSARPRLGRDPVHAGTDRYGYDATYLRGRIIGALGGMAAEAGVFDVITTGSESDLEVVTRIARSMVGRWGMSERVGKLSVFPAEGDPRMAGVSDDTLNAVDEEVRRITDECYAEARRLFGRTGQDFDRIVEQLMLARRVSKRRKSMPRQASIVRSRPSVLCPFYRNSDSACHPVGFPVCGAIASLVATLAPAGMARRSAIPPDFLRLYEGLHPLCVTIDPTSQKLPRTGICDVPFGVEEPLLDMNERLGLPQRRHIQIGKYVA